MTATCKNLCYKYKAKRETRKSPYLNAKHCIQCAVSMMWEGAYCPCCGVKLRKRAHANMARNADKKGVKRL